MNYQELQKRNVTLERRWKIVLIVAVLFVITRPVALYIVNNLIKNTKEASSCNDDYKYLNTAIICERPVLDKTGYAETQEKIANYINQQGVLGNAKEVSIYFRDLKNGPAWGINELSDFAPASLLKLPLVIAYMTFAEKDPSLLQKKLTFSYNDEILTQSYKPEEVLELGHEYTIENLLERTIKYSDNNAYRMAYEHLFNTKNGDDVRDIFLNLGFIAPKNAYDEVVSVRRYASIYTILVNGSFLTLDYSEKLLAWLSGSDFKDALVAGIPEKIKVAHKFGERFSPDGSKQFHDCGIVYYPGNPYLLCIMTRGTDFDNLLNIIKHISNEIYLEVDSRKIK